MQQNRQKNMLIRIFLTFTDVNHQHLFVAVFKQVCVVVYLYG